MAEFDIDFLHKEFGSKISQRIGEYEKAIHYYTSLASIPKLVFKDNIAVSLTYLYFHWLHNLVKPFVEERCDRFKVASITEFAVCYLQPITIEGYDAQQLRLINADFAFFCAMNIMINFNESDGSASYGNYHLKPFKGAIAPLEDRMEKILENHKRYLTTFDDTNITPPLISNAFSLELIDMFYTFQWQALSI